MRHSFSTLWQLLRRGHFRRFLYLCPRPGYCRRCGDFAWLTNEIPVYSSRDGTFLCEECAEENDQEKAAAWAEYHRGCL